MKNKSKKKVIKPANPLNVFLVLIAVIVLKVWNVNLDAWFGLAMSIYIIINK